MKNLKSKRCITQKNSIFKFAIFQKQAIHNSSHVFLHKTLDLKGITLDKAWIALDETLIIHFCLAREHLQTL